MPVDELSYQTTPHFDRLRRDLLDVGLATRPSTHVNVQPLTGKSETFIVQTVRHEERGDFIFVECMDGDGVTRLAIPPKVANSIASQRDSLTARRRSQAGKRLAAAMTDEQKAANVARLAQGRKKRKR